MKFSPDFHNYIGVNGMRILSPNLPLLHQINYLQAANFNDMSSLQLYQSENIHKSYRKTPRLQSLF